MRTTVTLDPDAVAIIRRRMQERGLSFKEAVNEAVRSSSRAGKGAAQFHTETAAMGRCTVNLDRALQLAAELEDDELLRRMRSGS